MIYAIIVGRKNSKGFPGKNKYKIFNHPLTFYPIKTAQHCQKIDKIFLSSDDPELLAIATSMGVDIIDRPAEFATDSTPCEVAYNHAYKDIIQNHQVPDFVVTMMCNAVTISVDAINEGIAFLENNPNFDSATTVSQYNMFNPTRARKIGPDGNLVPFVDLSYFSKNGNVVQDRDYYETYFADMGCSVVRPHCLLDYENSLPPQKWLGKTIAPIFQKYGFDVDHEADIPAAKWWLQNYWDVNDILLHE